jgi:hypothetical protein
VEWVEWIQIFITPVVEVVDRACLAVQLVVAVDDDLPVDIPIKKRLLLPQRSRDRSL